MYVKKIWFFPRESEKILRDIAEDFYLKQYDFIFPSFLFPRLSCYYFLVCYYLVFVALFS